MKKVLVPVFSFLLTIGSAGIGIAATCDEDKLIEQITTAYPTLSVEEINSTVALGYGYAEITFAAGLAEAAGITFSEVIAYAQNDLSWGEIAVQLKLDPGKFGQNVRQLFAQPRVKCDPLDLAQEEALIREMIQNRVRLEANLQQAGSGAKENSQGQEVKQTNAKQSQGQKAAKGSKGA